MSDEISIAEKQYVSSKRAGELSGYTQDYIGQLARGGYIDAQRIGGLWYVFMESLLSYKEKADSYKPQPPLRVTSERTDPESLISFDGRDYISAQRAAKMTRYNQDYIGQLAREGKILARRVGGRWYVDRDAILSHKEEKDALLAAVQAESVGIARNALPEGLEGAQGYAQPDMNLETHMTYIPESRDLLPLLVPEEKETPITRIPETPQTVLRVKPIPSPTSGRSFQKSTAKKISIPGKTMSLATAGAVVLTIVIVLSVGFLGLRSGSVYTVIENSRVAEWGREIMAASSGTALDRALDVIETYLAPELLYQRGRE